MSSLEFYWPYGSLILLALFLFGLRGKRALKNRAYLTSHLAVVVEKISGPSANKASASRMNLWLILFWLLLTIALMRPIVFQEPIEMGRSGRSIMLALDISESMEAEDFLINNQPVNRLEVAKSVLVDFIGQRQGDRLGLLVFGSETFLHAPLSFDTKMIKTFVLEAQIGFAGPRTALGDAIGLGVKKLLDQKRGDRIIVLLTDGQNNTGALEPMKAAEIAKNENIKLYIVGLGANKMLVDGFFGRTAVNPSRDLEEAEPLLNKMAAMTGGIYFRAKDSAELLKVYRQIDSLEPVEIENLVIRPKKELFYWPLLAAVLLMLLLNLWPALGRSMARI